MISCENYQSIKNEEELEEEQERGNLYNQLLADYDPDMCDYNSYKRWCRNEAQRRIKEKEMRDEEIEREYDGEWYFVNLINKIKESQKTITISEFFDNCINKAEENYINTKWFMEFKCQIEEELKKYADEHFFSIDYILRNNRVERMENGLIVLLGKEIKYKDKIFEIYFPSEFNNKFVLARSIF